LFIDKIHRFSKSQQDSLLGAAEKGWMALISATTESPSFEVIPALLSRCQVCILNALAEAKLSFGSRADNMGYTYQDRCKVLYNFLGFRIFIIWN